MLDTEPHPDDKNTGTGPEILLLPVILIMWLLDSCNVI